MLDLRRLCNDKGIPYLEEGHHHCHTGWAQINCPFCSNGTSGFHLGFNLEFGNFNCWRCGKHKTREVVSSLFKITDKTELYQLLGAYQKQGSRTTPTKKTIIRKKDIKLPDGTEEITAAHKKYLRKRKFDPNQIVEEWGILGTTYLSGEWDWRVIIPIHNQKGQMIAYVGRAINDDVKPKYKMVDNKYALEDPQGLLYGLNKVKKSSLIIVEGPTDVWRIGPGAVCTFGIDWRVQQANKLRQFDNKYILFDPEPLAQKRAFELAKWLSAFPGQVEVISGFDVDPGDFTLEQVKQIRTELLGDN